ncbi:protein LIFEGUARD 2-like [Phragmites australis]|uniref:protein LIFEGUARD 2-like n=1 Tax=Phragmites australis TaxID=29695 RepID=UPI002D76FE31|nr:protein LIFEGUARD 2-like [Phragmites australis]
MESPNLRWALVHKIYVILTVQLTMTTTIAAFVVKVRAISEFFLSSNAGIVLYIFLIILPLIVLCPLHYYHQKHPINLLLLDLFTVANSFAVGMTCTFTSGNNLAFLVRFLLVLTSTSCLDVTA